MLALASTSPKAHVLAFIVTAIFASWGTLTAAGPKPSPQHPVKIALAISVPFFESVTVNSGDLPKGCQTV